MSGEGFAGDGAAGFVESDPVCGRWQFRGQARSFFGQALCRRAGARNIGDKKVELSKAQLDAHRTGAFAIESKAPVRARNAPVPRPL